MDVSKATNISELFSAKDLVVVITGGGTGIGLAFTAAIASSDASRIFILGRRLEPLQNAASASSKFAGQVVPIQCDVVSTSSITSAAAQIAEQTTHVDVLINNAGITGPSHTDLKSAKTIEELQSVMSRGIEAADGGWAATFAINTTAVVGVSAAFLPLLDRGNARRGWVTGKREAGQVWERDLSGARAKGLLGEGVVESDQRTSQIITVASISGFNREITAGLPYTASKAGAILLGKSMSNFLAPWGIRSNVIAPGRFPSEMTVGTPTVFSVDQIPQGAPGTYDDLAGTVLYMVGRSGTYLNGTVQVVDGGRLSVMPATF